jgi:hypothetical protein
VAKFDRKDAAETMKDILVFLPSFDNNDNGSLGVRPIRGRDDKPLRTLLERAASLPKENPAPRRNPVNLEQPRLYLKLSDFVYRERSASDPVQLWRFYRKSSLMGKITLGRPSAKAPLSFILHLARAPSARGRWPPSPDGSESASST